MSSARRKAAKPPFVLRAVIPLVLVLVWLAVAGIGSPKMGQISDVATNDQSSFLPESAESTAVQDRLSEFRDSEGIPAVVVLEGKDGANVDPKALQQVSDAITAEAPDGTQVSPVIPAEDGEAAQIVAVVPQTADVATVVEQLRSVIEANAPNNTVGYVTGPAGFTADLSDAFAGIDGLLLLVAVAVVFVILVIVYRSPILPIIVLLSAMTALVAAAAVNIELARNGIVQINGQIQGILFILVIGAATDYGLLYVARYREELERFTLPSRATWAAIKGTVEPILASGGTVIVGLMCLLFSDLTSNSGLGPVASVGIVMAMLTALTFLPAMLVIVGRVAFWPKKPRTNPSAGGTQSHGAWRKVSALVERRPRTLVAAVTAFLVAGCAGLTLLNASGVPESEFVLGESSARDGQSVLAEHFPAGSGSPTYVIAPEGSYETVAADLVKHDGVEAVSATSKDSPSGTIPLNAEGKPEGSGPFSKAKPTASEGDVLLEATLSDPSDSLEAENTIRDLRSELAASDVQIGGPTATDLDTNDTSAQDRNVIIPIVLAAITLMLALLLRSLVAPVVLLATTVLSFGTALGISALIFRALGFTGSDPSVSLYGFVFLVALGIDYNIFLMTRVREESLIHDTREGVHRGLVSTGGVITSAGVVLAATFAALVVIPIQFLLQLAIVVSLGVLIDALIVRSFLVPSLALWIGNRIWWPSRVPRKSGADGVPERGATGHGTSEHTASDVPSEGSAS